MKAMRFKTGLLAAVLAAGLARADEVPPEIAERIRALESAFSAQDAQKASALVAEDATFINPRGERAKGRGAVEKLLRGNFAGPLKGAVMRMRVEDVRLLGNDLALLDVDQEVTGPNLPKTIPQPAHVHAVVLMRKQGSGPWMVLDARPYYFLPPEHGAQGAR